MLLRAPCVYPYCVFLSSHGVASHHITSEPLISAPKRCRVRVCFRYVRTYERLMMMMMMIDAKCCCSCCCSCSCFLLGSIYTPKTANRGKDHPESHLSYLAKPPSVILRSERLDPSISQHLAPPITFKNTTATNWFLGTRGPLEEGI